MSDVTISESEYSRLKGFEGLYSTNLRALKHVRQQVVFWQGKFAMVKQENNKLRARLYRRAK